MNAAVKSSSFLFYFVLTRKVYCELTKYERRPLKTSQAPTHKETESEKGDATHTENHSAMARQRRFAASSGTTYTKPEPDS